MNPSVAARTNALVIDKTLRFIFFFPSLFESPLAEPLLNKESLNPCKSPMTSGSRLAHKCGRRDGA